MLRSRPSPNLRFIPTAAAAAAATATATTAMSLRPSPAYRGGRNQWRGRGFSSRPYAPTSDQIVAGTDANGELTPNYNPRPSPFQFRPSFDPAFNQNQSFQLRGQPSPLYSDRNPQFAPPPLYYQNQQFRRQGQPQPQFDRNQQFRPPPLYNQGQSQPQFDRNQQFRPQGQPPQPFRQFRPQQQLRKRQSKPLDYRNWEYAKPGPPPGCVRFTVLSYNILADYLAMNHRSKLYFHIPRHILDWELRKRNIMFELGLWSADILCFQEVDKFQDLEEDLKVRGYSGIWKMRTGEPVDGCAIFWHSSRFKLLHEEAIEFNKFGLRDNVAQICVLESINENNSAGSAPPTCSEVRNRVVICNIHVLYNPRRGEIKLGQVRLLLDRAYATSKLWDDAPVVLCGDFNSTPKSPLYNFISEQKLNVSELPRDNISGQYSAEIRPRRPFSSVRAQSTDNSTQSPSSVDNKEIRQEEATIQEDSSSSMSSSAEPQSINITPNISASSFSEKETTAPDGLPNISSLSVTDDNNDDPLSTEELSLSNVTNEANNPVDEITASPNEPLEGTEDGSPGEDSTSFLSELRGTDESEFVDGNETSDLSMETLEVLDGSLNVDRETFNAERPAYDPSAWTPMEIAAATGSSECTTMEHLLKLKSTYSEVEDFSGARDTNGEPQVTSYHRGFMGTVDYIWRSKGLQTVRVLAPIPRHAMQWTPGFPTKRWGSDHVALVTELAFYKEVDDQD